jgi:hypothetical protein
MSTQSITLPFMFVKNERTGGSIYKVRAPKHVLEDIKKNWPELWEQYEEEIESLPPIEDYTDEVSEPVSRR